MKKFLSLLNVVLILFYSVWTDQFLVSASLELTAFTIKNVSATTYSMNPGDRFSMDIKTANTLSEAIKQVFVKVNFGNNAGFSYDGIDQKTRISGASITSPVPSSAYSSSNGLNFEVTTAGNTQIAAWAAFDFSRSSNTHTGFVVNPNISTYANALTTWYEAQKVSDSSTVVGTVTSKTIYINVKPHITDYSFSKSSIVGNGGDSTDLTVKVKDYNGCANVDGGTVTANLASLWLSSLEALTYDSCDADGKTAVFKKTAITTLSATGDKTFSYTDFAAKDEDNNSTDPTDANTAFDNEDRKTDMILTVATPNAPVVTIASVVPDVVSSQDSILSFLATQSGSYKVVINGDGSCSAGTVVMDWTNYGTSGATINTTIPTSALNTGSNTLYACVKNMVGDIGGANVILTKDLTPPVISNTIVSPGNVVTSDSSTSFQCSENGTYRVTMNAFDSGYQSAIASTANTVTLPNTNIAVGANTVNIFCKDQAGNESTTTASVSKVAPPPAMTASGLTLIDNDIAWDGVDGRDLKVTWDSTIGNTYSGFDSYRIYILPENTALTGSYLGLVANSGATVWTGSSTIVNDSLWNPLSAWNYVAYVAIMGTSGQLGTAASATGTLVADIIPHPSVLSASFTSTGNLRVKFDTTLKTDTGSHSATGFVYQVGSTTYTGTSVSSVASDTVNLSIPDLSSTSSTGTLTIATGSVWGTATDGSYNYGTGGIAISDAINPNITGFATGTTAYYANFYSGSLVFDYNISENLAWAGNTKIVFTRVGWNADTSKTHNITTPANLTAGAHSETVNLSSLGLVSGAYYDVSLVAKDTAGNTAASSPVTVKFDNAGPSVVSINPFGPNRVFGILMPTFTWIGATDDGGNGSGVKGYKIRVYSGTTTYTDWKTCTGSFTEYVHTDLNSLSKDITFANLSNYAWGVYAYDNMENVGTLSSCDNFYINTDIPNFSAASITDTVLNSTSYTKGGNNLVIQSTITNSDSSHIWLNASSIKDGSYANISCASPVAGVTCSYVANVAAYTFSAGASAALSSGVKQAQFTATNIAGINTGTTLASITLDNTAPAIAANTLTSPISGTFGWTGTTIAWTAGNITDNIGISYVKLEYYDGASWNLIGTGANAGTYPWNIAALPSGASYQVRISAYDGVGLSSVYTGAVFSIDKVAPTVPGTTVTYPNNAGIKIKGGSSVNITWDSGNITDNIWLAANPITLSYSTDGGTNYTQIATNLPNNGTYAWAVPTGLNNTNMKIRLEATDNVGNKSSDASDNVFETDSTAPSVTVTYAGNGGTTPQTNSHINSSGFDVSASVSDNNLAGGNIYYSLYDQTNGTYFNGTAYAGGAEVWNTLATSTGSSYSLSSTVTSSIIDGHYYKLKIRADDSVGNTFSTPQVTFVGDTVNPALSVTTASGTYFSGSVSIAGTSSDTGSSISSVNLEIQKGGQWWDGANWVGSQQRLVASTSNGYANWSYDFNPSADGDGQAYTVTAIASDHAYKTNNTSSSAITVTKDVSGPVIADNAFTHAINGIQKDGNIVNITWNTAAIVSTGAGIAPNSVVLKFNNGAGIATITGATANDGSYSYTLPTGDTQNAFFAIEASDTLGNISNTVVSSGFALDSTPPTIGTVETIEDTLGQINGVNIYFSELIDHASIRLSDFSIAGVAGMQTGTISDVGTGTVFAIHFTSTGTTATTPSVTYAAGTLTDLAQKPLANVTKPAEDKATPRFTSAKIYDNNGNGKVDRIVVQASEPLSANTDTSSWTLNSPLAGVSISSASVVGNTAVLILTEPATANTSTGGMSVSFANTGNWKDGANNSAPSAPNLLLADMAIPTVTRIQTADNSGSYAVDVTFSEPITGTLSGFTLSGTSTFTGTILSPAPDTLRFVTTDSTATDTAKAYSLSYNGSGTALKDGSDNFLANFPDTAVTDAIAPKILSRETQDADHNGHIDAIKLTFSENLNDAFGSLSVTVGSFVIQTYSTTCGGINTVGDAIVCVGLQEQPLADSDSTPMVQVSSNSSLGDMTGNILPGEPVPTQAADKSGPVITGARFDGLNKISLNFSENVTGTLNAANFLLSGATSSVSSVSFASGSSTAEVTLTGSGIAYGTSKISFSSGTTQDQGGNSSVISYSTISASVVINEINWGGSASGTADEWIELRNMSNTVVSLSGWVLQNAGWNGTDITFPAGASIGAGGYYLIANYAATNGSSKLNVTPDLVTATVSLSNTPSYDLVLKDSGGITYDTVGSISGWAAGSASPDFSSMERLQIPWDGKNANNWYTAVASVWFDDTSSKGTPASANVFDAALPIIASFTPANNTLYPMGNIHLTYAYSDSGGMAATPDYTFLLEKNNGAGGYSDVTAASLSSSGINASAADFATNTLAYGQYRATFTVNDAAGNTAQQVSTFYVDAPSLTVSTGSYAIGALSTSSTVIGAGEVTVTVRTIGAGFRLSLGGSGTLDAGISQIGTWNGTTGYGMDYAATGSGTAKAYSGTLTGVSGATLEDFATGSHIGGNGNLHTFTYTVKYGGKIDVLQAAGVYSSDMPVNVSLQY